MINLWSKCTHRECLIKKVRYIVMHSYGTLCTAFENIKKLDKCDPPSFLGSFYVISRCWPFLKVS